MSRLESYPGLRLAGAAIAFLAASWLFGGVAEDVVSGDPLTIVDVYVADWLHGRATPAVTAVMLAVTHAHGVIAIGTHALLAAAYLAWERDWYWLLCVGVAVPGGMILNALAKLAFRRARPSFEHPLLDLATYSFPSGHVAGATLLYGVLAAMLVRKCHAWRARALIVSLALALVALVAASRMYLGVHYLSDTIAAFAQALAWLTLCLAAIDKYWNRRVEPPRRGYP